MHRWAKKVAGQVAQQMPTAVTYSGKLSKAEHHSAYLWPELPLEVPEGKGGWQEHRQREAGRDKCAREQAAWLGSAQLSSPGLSPATGTLRSRTPLEKASMLCPSPAPAKRNEPPAATAELRQ